MSSSSPGGGSGRPPIWVVVLGLLVLMARLTEAAQNLRQVLANDSDSITKTKDKIKPTTTDLVDTEAATSKLVQDDVVEDTAEAISTPNSKNDAAKDATEKNLRHLAESSNNDQDADDEVEPDFMYWVTPLQSLGLTCGGSSIKSRNGEYTCIKAGEALCQDNDGGPFGRWTFGITEDNQVNLWTPKNEIAWTFCTVVSHVCIGEERDPRPDKYSNQRPYLYFYDEKTQRTVGNLTCDGTDGFNGENLDKPTILKMVDNSNVGMYANYNITVLKFKKGQTPDPGDSNELLNITVAKVGQRLVGSLSFNDNKCTWSDRCPTTCPTKQVGLETAAYYDTIVLEGWDFADISFFISFASSITSIVFELDSRLSETELDSIENILNGTEINADAPYNIGLIVPYVARPLERHCLNRPKANLFLPKTVKRICTSVECRPVVCEMGLDFDTNDPNRQIYLPSNSHLIFGNSNDCTIVKPAYWDEWVATHFGNDPQSRTEDFYLQDQDDDGVSNILEYYGLNLSQYFYDLGGSGALSNPLIGTNGPPESGTDPNSFDSDGDLLVDSFELLYGSDPLLPNDINIDTDNDGLTDFEEQFYHTNPFSDDTDGDFLSDFVEGQSGSNPLNDLEADDGENFHQIALSISGSESEHYSLSVGGIDLSPDTYGGSNSRSFAFKPGSYTIKVKHWGSNVPDNPIFGYEASISWEPTVDFDIMIDDPLQLLGENTVSEYDYSAKKEALLTITDTSSLRRLALSNPSKCEDIDNCEFCNGYKNIECQWNKDTKACKKFGKLKKVGEFLLRGGTTTSGNPSLRPFLARAVTPKLGEKATADYCPCTRCKAWTDQADRSWINRLPQCYCELEKRDKEVSPREPFDHSPPFENWSYRNDYQIYPGLELSLDHEGCLIYENSIDVFLRGPKDLKFGYPLLGAKLDIEQWCCYREIDNRIDFTILERFPIGNRGAGTPRVTSAELGLIQNIEGVSNIQNIESVWNFARYRYGADYNMFSRLQYEADDMLRECCRDCENEETCSKYIGKDKSSPGARGDYRDCVENCDETVFSATGNRQSDPLTLDKDVLEISAKAAFLSDLAYFDTSIEDLVEIDRFGKMNIEYQIDGYEKTFKFEIIKTYRSANITDEGGVVDQAILAFDKEDKRCYGAFRGTLLPENIGVPNVATDWATNVFPLFDTPACGKCGCCDARAAFVSSYYNSFEEEFRKDLLDCVWECGGFRTNSDCLVLTGHSQGGSLATIAALALADLDPWIITVGQPPVVSDDCPILGKLRIHRYINAIVDGDGVFRHDPVAFLPCAYDFGHTIILGPDKDRVATGVSPSKFSRLPILGDTSNKQETCVDFTTAVASKFTAIIFVVLVAIIPKITVDVSLEPLQGFITVMGVLFGQWDSTFLGTLADFVSIDVSIDVSDETMNQLIQRLGELTELNLADEVLFSDGVFNLSPDIEAFGEATEAHARRNDEGSGYLDRLEYLLLQDRFPVPTTGWAEGECSFDEECMSGNCITDDDDVFYNSDGRCAPVPEPSALPSSFPSTSPSSSPTASGEPSSTPSSLPSSLPTLVPSDVPSDLPSISLVPSTMPSDRPSSSPSISLEPSTVPSNVPSSFPSISREPSFVPGGQTLYFKKYLLPSDASSFNYFGRSVALSDEFAVMSGDVRGSLNGNPLYNNGGSVYIYERNNMEWLERIKFEPGSFGDEFGYSVAIGGSRNELVLVGSPREDTDQEMASGSVYFVKYSGASWSLQSEKLTAPGGSMAFDNFGWAIAMRGNTAVIGAPGADIGGAAYIFTYDGSSWDAGSKLVTSLCVINELDQFGMSVAIDGDFVFIAMPGNDDVGLGAGAVCAFKRDSSGIWQDTGKIYPNGGLGYEGALSISGNYALIGAEVFELVGTSWLFATSLSSFEHPFDQVGNFGVRVSLRGNIALISAGSIISADGAFMFTRDDSGVWDTGVKLTDFDQTRIFGGGVAQSDNFAIFGDTVFDKDFSKCGCSTQTIRQSCDFSTGGLLSTCGGYPFACLPEFDQCFSFCSSSQDCQDEEFPICNRRDYGNGGGDFCLGCSDPAIFFCE